MALERAEHVVACSAISAPPCDARSVCYQTPRFCRCRRSRPAPNCCCLPSPMRSCPAWWPGWPATGAVRRGPSCAHFGSQRHSGTRAADRTGLHPAGHPSGDDLHRGDEDWPDSLRPVSGITAARWIGYAIAQSLVLEIGGTLPGPRGSPDPLPRSAGSRQQPSGDPGRRLGRGAADGPGRPRAAGSGTVDDAPEGWPRDSGPLREPRWRTPCDVVGAP